jgi:hypothetical protein
VAEAIMPLFETIPLVLVGVVVVLTPIFALGVTASKLDSHQRTGVTVIFAGTLFLVGIIAVDALGALPDRLPIDLALVAGGVSLGSYATLVLRPRWSSWRRSGK